MNRRHPTFLPGGTVIIIPDGLSLSPRSMHFVGALTPLYPDPYTVLITKQVGHPHLLGGWMDRWLDGWMFSAYYFI